jgi:replicative DNA helicase
MGEKMNNPYQTEAVLLGCFFKQPDLMDDCYLRAEEFCEDERHSLIFEYLKFTYEQDGTIDFVLMAERSGNKLSRMGGVSYLSQLASAVDSTKPFNNYQAIIRNSYIQRESSVLFESMSVQGQREGLNVKQFLAEAKSKLEELEDLAPKQSGTGMIKMSQVLDDSNHIDMIQKRTSQQGMTGPPTVSKKIDKITGGHQAGDYEVLAARPSMGKTACMGNDAINVARSGAVAGVFSAEMTSLKITERIICALGNLDSHKLRSGGFTDSDWERYSYARDELEKLNLLIDDAPGMTLQYIRSTVKKMVKDFPNKRIVIYIDYLQLLHSGLKFPNRREEVEYISRSLKLMSKQYNITVVALSQLSRSVEQRPDKRPMLSDLRESGAIEQDADIITFLYRDDYYNKESEKKNIVEVIIAKGRDVGTGTVEMAFLKNISKFADLEYKQGDKNGKAS